MTKNTVGLCLNNLQDPPGNSEAPKVMQGLSLRENFAWTLAGNVVYAGCQWGMLIVLAKLGTPEMVGQFALGLAITAPIMMFAYLGLRTVQATDAKSDFLFGHYVVLRAITSCLALLVIICIILLAGYRRETALVVLILGLAKTFESFSDVIYGLLQRHERMDRIAISMIIKGFLSMAALGLGVYVSGKVFWGVMGLAVMWALVLIFYDLRSSAIILKDSFFTVSEFMGVKGFYLLCDLNKLYTLFLLALPLGAVALLWSLKVNIPLYFIEHHLGERELGIFAALTYLMTAGKTMVSAFSQAAVSRLAKYYALGDITGFSRLLFSLIGLASLLGFIGLMLTSWAGKQILTLFYRPEYASYADILFFIMLAATFNYVGTLLFTGLDGVRYFKIQTFLQGLITIAMLIASYLLIPTFGLKGAAFALIIAGIVELIFPIPFLKKGLSK